MQQFTVQDDMTEEKDRQPIIEVRNVSKSFPGVQALDQVSLDIYAGEVHVVMGENGAGKSTLMKILAGVYHPDSGEILLEGEQVHVDNPLQAQHLGINLINQELAIATNLTVAENVFMGREPTRFGVLNRQIMEDETRRVLKLLGAEFEPTEKAGRLMVAEQQQVDISRALVNNSRVIIMDEPTAALSETETKRLFDLVKSLRDQGIAIIYISHRLAEISVIADKVSVLRDGKYVGTVTGEEMDKQTIVRMMVGRPLADFYEHEVSSEKKENYLVVKNLDDGKKVHNVSFQAAAGEILAISGLVGSGRTELARLIFGADKKVSGEIFLRGKKVEVTSPNDAMQKGIGYVPEDRKDQGLFLEMSAHENIVMNVIPETSKFGVLSGGTLFKRTKAAISRLNIRLSSPRNKALSLSGGNQQKLLLARWLEIAPEVLILDEPTRGVDVGAKSEIYRIIGEIAQRGVAVIFISSELPEVVGLAQRVLVLREGHLVADLTEKGDINQETIMAYATGVRDPMALAQS
ncbi:MAG: sugar ABC transporter ATP-binding protein [Spirochaetaceae bacterium]